MTSTEQSAPGSPFFVDRSLSRRLVPEALRQAGFEVFVHDDIFAADTPDTEWLAEAGAAGWIVLTKDDRIRYRRREWAVVETARVQDFVIANAKLTGPEQAALLVEHGARIQRWAAANPGPFVVGVYAQRPHLRQLAPRRRQDG